MAYCCKCGNGVQDTDRFCAKCGGEQAGARPASDFAASFSPRTAAVLCYVPWLGWIVSIVVLASNTFRHDRTVRFHAFQGLYLFVAWLIVQWVFKPWEFFMGSPHVPVVEIMKLALLVLSIFMMVKAGEGRPYALPILGELAERSLTEK
jgi:uncharacterized membrane protein